MAKRRSKKRRGLGSSPVIHTQQAAKASDDIQYAAVLAINKARNGRCTAATMAYADMQQAIGRYEAHIASGGKAWKPQSAIQDAAFEYNQHCVRESARAALGTLPPPRCEVFATANPRATTMEYAGSFVSCNDAKDYADWLRKSGHKARVRKRGR